MTTADLSRMLLGVHVSDRLLVTSILHYPVYVKAPKELYSHSRLEGYQIVANIGFKTQMRWICSLSRRSSNFK